MRYILAIFIFALATVVGVHAAVPTVRPIMETQHGETPIQLQSLHINSVISGGMAETTVRMVFFNPNSRPLEGNLQFPLLDGQQVIGFALDVNGRLRPAVPVEKAKGRQIFEAIERRNIDPALLEKTQGNNFKLRVYPIGVMATRTVEVTYTEALQKQGANWSYRLPLAYGAKLKDFDLNLQVNGARSTPKVTGALGAVRFTATGNQYQARISKNNFAPTGSINILLAANPQPQTYIQSTDDGSTYFVTEIPVSTKRYARPLPKVVGLLWDSSGSGVARAHEAELFELDRYFKAIGNAEIRLTRLRDHAEPVETFKIINGNWDALRKALLTTVYDGASALGDWQPQADVNEYLLVSDGLANYGPAAFPTLASEQRLYALSSSMVMDADRLAAIAERNGGRLIQINSNRPGAAAEALLTEGPHIQTISATGASNLLLDSGSPQQGLLRVAGKLLNSNAQINLTLVENGKTINRMIPVSAQSPKSSLAAYQWAGYRLHQLEADFEAHRAEIRRVGTLFGIPTRETSLIVLDQLADYVRYDVTPPTELMPAFEALKAQQGVQLAEKKQKHLEKIVTAFEQKVAWWEKSYPKETPPPPIKEKKQNDSSDTQRTTSAPRPVMAMAARPVPAPVPAPVTATIETEQGSISPEIGITLKKWTSDAPYMTRLNAASAADIYAVYLDEKPSYAMSSAFYLDAADALFDKGQHELGLRVLSNLAEMDLENRQVLRILGYRLLQAGAPELAIPVFEKVQRLAEEEPQSFRDLGLAHAAAGHYQLAIDQLNEVILRPWDNRFAEIELIALAEMNAIIATAEKKSKSLDTRRIDPRLRKNLPLDIRAVLTWDADNSDMDLWVTDPNGEKCFYGHRFTYQGGRMSLDFTGGYGPEEFSLREAKPGKYKIEANYYGNRQQVIAGATTLQVKLTSGFGSGNDQEKVITLRLKDRKETVFVGEFEVKAK